MPRSPFQGAPLKLETPKGSRLQAEAWMQGGELRIAFDGLLNATVILTPQSVRAACEEILRMLDAQP